MDYFLMISLSDGSSGEGTFLSGTFNDMLFNGYSFVVVNSPLWLLELATFMLFMKLPSA